jgi:hypothetical protein
MPEGLKGDKTAQTSFIKYAGRFFIQEEQLHHRLRQGRVQLVIAVEDRDRVL